MKKVARIFSDIGGYFICDNDLPYLDTRGGSYETKAQAMRIAPLLGYTHCVGSGTYKPDQVHKIPEKFKE